MRKKLLLSSILLLLILSVLNAKTPRVSAGEYPAIYIDPAITNTTALGPGTTFTISIKTDYNGSDIWGWDFTLTYNPLALNFIDVINGDLITEAVDPGFDFKLGILNETTLRAIASFSAYPEPVPLTSGPGTLANVTFKVVGTGDSDVTLGPDTVLQGVTEGGSGNLYKIIDGETMPTHIQHGFFCNTAIHDIAVTSVTPSLTRVAAGELVHITAVVENQGIETETFNVTLYYNTTAIQTKTDITLVAGANKPLTFAWNTTGVSTGTHTINATASTVPGETDTGDNTGTCDVTVTSQYIAVIPQSTVDPTLTPGNNYTVSIYTDYNGTDIWGWEFTLTYNPSVLHGVKVTNGDLITKAKNETATFQAGTFDNVNGKLSLTGAFFNYGPPPVHLTSGPGTLANVTFTVVDKGDSDIELGTETFRPSRLIGYTEDGYGVEYNIIDDITPDLHHIVHGYFRNTAEPITHDIAITSVTTYPAMVIVGEHVNITVDVKNEGTVTEMFEVKVYFDNIHPNWLIGEETGTLDANRSVSLTFTWGTTDVWPGTHTVIAVANPVHGEKDTEDNTLISPSTVTVLQYERELAVSLEVPDFLMPGDSTLVNATVCNLGINETGVKLFLLIDGTVVNSTIIPELVSGACYTINYFWTPTLKARYNVTAYAPPVPGEAITVNNIATKLVTTYPLIHPMEGQWANYTLYSEYDKITSVNEWNFTYDHYVSPYLINITMWFKGPEGPIAIDWMVVNIMNRRVESGILAGQWYLGWIETDITLGSTINLLDGTATVVGSRIIEVDGYHVDCWELQYYPLILPIEGQLVSSTLYHKVTFWYDKASGLWIGMESTDYYYRMEVRLVATNIQIGKLPVAFFTYSPSDPVVGETVTFDASPSYDPNETIVSYAWDFGDGTSSTGMTTTHTFAAAETYTVTLIVTNDAGLTDTTTATVTVSRVALDVEVDVGSIHFRGEMADFYVLVSLMGEPVNASISTTLYCTGTLYANLSAYVQHVEIGLYRVPYTIPTDAPTGTYELVVKASYLALDGMSLKSFLLSPTLTGTLISINGTVVWIKTEIGTIEGRIISIEGSIATVETDVGTIKTLLEGWTGGTTSPITTPLGDSQILVLTTSSLEGPVTFSDDIVSMTLSGPLGTTGTTNVVIPKQLLIGDESSIDKVVVTIDDEQVLFTYTEETEAYLLEITYTHSTHTIKVYLTGLPPTPFPWAVLITILVVAVVAAASVAIYILKIRKPRVASGPESAANLGF